MGRYLEQQNKKGALEKPENPRDKKYLKYCFVCSEEAKPGKEHLKNYGGVVCLSCRAFWRRSHQTTKNPILLCKKGNNCVLTAESRRHCKKCRYQKCLLAGMKPEAVLDSEQKKIHFRKYYSRQEKSTKTRKKKCLANNDKTSSRQDDRPLSPSPSNNPVLLQQQIVKIPQRTPERGNLENEEKSSDIKTESEWTDQDPRGFQSYPDPINFSTFESPNFQLCSYDYNYEAASQLSVAENTFQNRIQLPDLDNIHNEALFYWNSFDLVN